MTRELRIEKSKRKTLSLSITKEGRILVKAPYYVENAVIETFIRKHEAWIEKQMFLWKERKSREEALMLTPERIERLKEKARIYLTDRVRYYSNRMGVRPTGIKITSAKTRWGSCSARNSICFSYRLILLHPDAVDYVVVHELAHIREKNHGAGFYREVETYLPDYRRRIALLKEEQKRLGL